MAEDVQVRLHAQMDLGDVVSNVNAIQQSFNKLKLPDKIGDNLNKNITAFMKEYDKYQKKISEGVKTQGDYNQVEKSLNNMRNLYQAIGKDAEKLTRLDMKDMLNLDTAEFRKISTELTNIIKQIGNAKIDTTPFTQAFADIRKITKSSKITGDNGILSQMIGHINTGQITEAKKELQALEAYAKKVAPRMTAEGKQAPGTLSAEKYQQLTAAINVMSAAFGQADAAMAPLLQRQNELQSELEETKQKAAQGITNEFSKYSQASAEVDRVTDSLKRMHQEEFSFSREVQNVDRQIQSYFGLSQMIRKVGDIAKDAFSTVKELDKAMTETAVVTNFNVGDMWNMLPTYTEQANQLGSTIKDVYEAATLYYQQGLNTNQAMSLANETLKMARIAGLEAAEATDMMTAALRGFNMEINQMSAQKINDVYSELAAITASDTKEIGSAMERTASIANSANMEFETTSAFLAQMIETTREAPENLGTAMKTIVARFQEMKKDPTKLIDSEGVAMDANKVDTALKSIGVNLMNTKGEFRDLDDVFLDIASRWDSLTQGQQRYIATIAAGSRQQSRFIAMMSNYERTMELVDAANNSAGASQRQFEKTLDSMEAKLNKLKNAWDQFTMGLMNNQVLKVGVDFLTKAFTIVNKLIDVLGSIPPKPFEGITKSALTLATTLGMLQLGKKMSRGLVMGTTGWWKNEPGGFTKNFAAGWGSGTAEAGRSGTQAGMTWSQFAAKAINSGSGGIKQAMRNAMQFNQAAAPVAIENELRNVFQGLREASDNFGFEGEEAANEYIEAVLDSIRNGQQSIRQAIEEVFKTANREASAEEMAAIEEQIQKAAKSPVDFNKTSTDFDGLTQSATKAGTAIQQFGYALQGTPLEGFGNALIKIGRLMESTAKLAKTVGKKLGDAFKAAKGAEAGKGISTFFQTLLPGLTKLVTAHPILAAIAAAITAIGIAAVAVARHNKKAFETIQDSAAAASEAYDSAKQETSELADAIEKIQESQDAFSGLVAGTAAFNEQLVKTNQQITELLNKYPMLNDPKYLSTDNNGLMSINQEGIDKVKEYQRQRQANASALNLIQTSDLNVAEATQKAKQLRKSRGGDTTFDIQKRQKEAELVEQQAKAQAEVAKLNALNTSLVDEEIHNREKVSAILADQYDKRKKEVSLAGESIHDLKQEYADFYGYRYDKASKKMLDNEGNEVEVDKSVIKDAVKDIRVLTSLEVDAASLDKTIGSIDRKFSKTLGEDFEDSGKLFSDILSDNADIQGDLIEKLLKNPDKLREAVNSLSEKEIAAVLGVSEERVAATPNKYQKELTNKLQDKITNIADSQAQSYTDLASMLAQTVGSSFIDKSGDVIAKVSKADEAVIKEQLGKLTSEQKNNLSSIGKALEESAGVDSMRTFIKQASDIYTKGQKESVNTLDEVIKDVNWSSPTARLKAYNDMVKSNDESIQKLGKSLLESKDSANLLGEAFEEFYDSSDFQDLAENMDKFVDASGKLNASSVQEMAEECNSLNNLLDTGAITAGGVAAALNALGSDGNLTLMDLNSHVLELLSTINQLDDAVASAHRSIENFDWGIDTGEAEDFVTESAKKWNELYDNGEFGNPQLEAYGKFVLGEENYIRLLNEKHGDLEEVMGEVAKTVNRYAEGFDSAWADLASGSWKDKNLPAELQEKGISMSYGDNGDIIWDPGTATTNELIQWLERVEGVSEDMAKIMLEDWENYSPDFKQERTKNDFEAGLVNGNYIKDKIDAATGQLNVTQSDLQTIANATGKSVKDVKSALIEKAGIDKEQLNVLNNLDKNGQLLVQSDKLSADYNKAKTGGKEGESWISAYKAYNAQGNEISGGVELKSAIAGAVEDGLSHDQAMYAAWTEAQKLQQEGGKMLYDGVELFSKDLADFDTFSDRIGEITENSQWTQVGRAIAEGYISYLKGLEDPNQPDETKGEGWTPARDRKEVGETKLTDGLSTGTPTEDPKEAARTESRQKFSDFVHGLIEGVKEGPTEDPKIAAGEQARERMKSVDDGIKQAAREQKTTGGVDTEVQSQIQTRLSKMWEGVKKAFSSTPTTNPDPKQTRQTSGEKTETKSQATVAYDVKISNAGEIKSSVQQQLNSILQGAAAKTQKVNAKGSIKVNYAKGSQAKAENQTAKVNYLKGTQAKPEAMNAKVNYTLGSQDEPSSPKSATVNYTLGTQDAPKDKTAKVNYVGSGGGGAKGINNYIPHTSAPTFGSLASGTRYGKVGPKNKGGLTLTGEKGFEIAWLPSQSKSMILGADGPQMVSLPADAVVYTHEQSKKIVKQKAIPAGSHSRRSSKHSNGGSSGDGGNSGGGGSGGGGGGNDTSEEAEKVIQKAGTVVVWWLNLARKTEAIQRKVDKNQKTYEKYLKKLTATLHGTGTEGGGDAYISSLRKSISVNQSALNRANKELKVLNQGSTSTAQNSTVNAAQNKVNKAQNKLNKAKTKKQKDAAKKELEAAKKNLTTAKKNALKATRNDVDAGGSVADISYEVTKKKGKEKTTETKEERVDLGGYINWDAASGTYVINQDAINKVAKTNGSKAKAIRDAAEDEINKRLQRKYEAEDAIAKAQEALEQLSEQLYETFFGWETALTRIWNITQKLEAAESGKTRTESFQDMLEAQLNSGKVDFANEDVRKKFMGKYTDNFKRTLEMQTQVISDRMDAIEQSKKDVQDALTSADEQKKIDAARSILGQDQAIKDAAARLGSAQSELSAAYGRVNSAASAQASAQARINAANSIIQSTGKTLNNKKASSSAKKKARDQRYTAFIERDAAQAALAKANADRMVAEASIAGYQAQVNAAQNAYTALKNNTRELTETEKLAYEEQVKRLEEQKKVEQDARNRYMKVKTLSDGTVVVDFNTELLEMDQENGLITQDHAKKIEDYVNKVIETSKTLGDNYEALTQELTNMYNSLAELKDEWAGYGEELKKIQEDASRKEIDALKRLYDAIANALKELLDKVKKSLDARRQTEDNAKVEQDIAKKQQRLAMLQASSSGTNAVEIAQLEQEIANAQQSYERTLEDQLLAKLQEQGNEAAAQRQRQIELLEAGVESINNIEDVNRWMANPIQYYDELHELYLQSKDWDNLTDAEREKVEIDWTTFFNGLATNQERQEEASGKIDALSALTTQSGTTDAIEAVEKSVEALDEQLKAREEIDALAKQTTLQAQQEAVATAQKVAAAQETARNETAAANAAKAQAQAAKYNTRIAVGNSPSAVAKTKYADAIKVAHKSKTITAAQLKDIVAMASQAGYSMSKVGSDLAAKDGAGGVTWVEVVRAAKKAGYSKSNVTKWWTSKVAKNAIKNWSQYATGGLADYTGPAWLDGTPSRPELVLNAQDTKNFLALKDVLAHAMGSIDSTSAGYGDMNYEININVDKISNDYDVDKMADRIKKIIVKDSSYRNVTQVRNLR